MSIGLIKWFDSTKGFGVIVSASENNQEVFIHISNWRDESNISSVNDKPIVFSTAIQRNKLSAIKARYFNASLDEDWGELFNLDHESNLIKIDYRTYNLLEIVLNNFPDDFEISTINFRIKNKIQEINNEESLRQNLLFRVSSKISNKKFKELILNEIIERANKLDDESQVKIWNTNLLKGFEPKSESIVKNLHLLFSIGKILQLEEESKRNVILIACVNNLKIDFNKSWFKEFERVIEEVKSDKFKEKLVNDLIWLGANIYKNYIIDFLRDDHSIFEYPAVEVESCMTEHPTFLPQTIIDEINKDIISLVLYEYDINDIVELWIKGLVSDISIQLKEKISKLRHRYFSDLLNHERFPLTLKKTLLDFKYDEAYYEFVLESCNKCCPEFFEEFDQKVFDNCDQESYYKLWEKGIGKNLPTEFLLTLFDENKSKISLIYKWQSSNLLTSQQLSDLVLKKIKVHESVESRNIFYKLYHRIKEYVYLNPYNSLVLKSLKDDFVDLIIWHLGYSEDFSLETLRRKFIFFTPEDQVYIFKRLFYLKSIEKIDFTFEYIESIVRADIDLFLLNEKFENDFILDISTHVIIEAIKSFVERGTFIFESDLILKDLKRNNKKKFQIEKYFDKCSGRMLANWNWKTEGKVKKVQFPNDSTRHYFSIDFPAALEMEGRNYYGTYTYHEKNPSFDNLLNEVKKLPGRKWNSEEKVWGVPSCYEKEVFQFARDNRFFIELPDRKHYENNIHLAEYSRYLNNEPNIPHGIQFCEGRKAKKEHSRLKREFWWCSNQECFENSVDNHLKFSNNEEVAENKIWEKYTLLDILKILDVNLDEHKTNPNDFINDGHYYKFVGHINAFNRLLEKLYCIECGELLYPTQSSHFALYLDTRFHCENDKCSNFRNPIYLNHCLNGECTNIIDSRVSKTCKHGLYICNNCGTCCSYDMFSRRLDNLKLTGGFIHQDLIKNVENKEGHLERKEYYCHKCQRMMTEISDTNYECKECGIEYDLEKFKWLDRKWTMIYARREDYPKNRVNY